MKRRNVHRIAALGLLALLLSVQAVAATTNCANFITSAGDDPPITGYLVGEFTQSTTKTYSWSYTNFGGTFNGSSAMTQSYSVGIYQMSDGSRQRLRCDGYVPV